MLNLNIAVLSFGILQSGLLGFALLRRKGKHSSSIYLLLFFVVIGLQLMFKLISKAWLWEHSRTVYMISYNYGYLIGPLLYLYFRSQKKETLFTKWDWLHFVPFVISTSLTIADEVFGVTYDVPFSDFFPWPSLQIISMISYGVVAWRLIDRSQVSMRQFLVIVLVVECIVIYTIQYLVNHISTAPDLRLVFTLLTAMMYWFTYRAIVAPEDFFPQRNVPVVALVAHATTRYANSGLRKEESNSILESLKIAIEKDHVFLQSGITIDDVAKKLAVKKHHLSQVINQELGTSFTDLVYNWRLDEAARRLNDPRYRDEKIAAIAFDLGFNSVSGFTTMFKKRFKVTPSAYRNETGQYPLSSSNH